MELKHLRSEILKFKIIKFPDSNLHMDLTHIGNSGNDPEEFPETIFRHWKKFPKKPLSHASKLQNLEKVS